MARFILFALILGCSAFPVAAQSDPLARLKAARALADQKAEAEIRDVILAAQKLAAASPTTAIQRLREAQVGLDLSAAITTNKRKELVALIGQAITRIQNPSAAPVVKPDPKLAEIKQESRRVFEAYLAEAKFVREKLAEIEALSQGGKATEAQTKTRELVAKYPNNPAVLTLIEQGDWRDRVEMAKVFAKEQEKRIRLNAYDVANSSLPPLGDIEYPANWKELTARRLKTEKLDPRTEAILKALDKPVLKGVDQLPFEETVQLLSNVIDEPLYLDKKSLEDAGLDMKRLVGMPGNVSARTALRAVLQSNGLTYIIKDGTIQVVTLEQAQKTLVTRTYYMGDALQGGPFNNATRFGPVVDYQQTMKNAQLIIQAITQSVDPQIWRDGPGRGPATIFFHFPSMSIIVRAPTEVHATLSGKLR